jgi:hypothetical protein
MSCFHCSCGFAIDDADAFGDHLRLVFTPDDDAGNDGRVHHELDDGGAPPGRHACACGFSAGGIAELDDHLLIVFIPSDDTGIDGQKHVVMDPSTPGGWLVQGTPG